MKHLTFIIAFLAFSMMLAAQQNATESEIKRLEQSEVKAILERDTIQLKSLWDKDYVVYNPEGRIVMSISNSVERPVLHSERVSFTREVKQITVNGNIAISMGTETVVPLASDGSNAVTINRRYTNIWMKKDGNWKLIARHANRF